MTSKFEVHEERLGTTDELGHRVFLHPEEVKGVWRSRRTLFYWVLIFIFLVLPWIHFNGKQIILLDLATREFTFFGSTFYAHDAPMLIMILLGFVFTMAFVTSIWGRVWCGWACPQTVFIDAIYRKIEQFIEGNSYQRTKLDEANWNLNKLARRSLKWFLYTIVSLHIAHSLIGYFVGTRFLLDVSTHNPSENMNLFLTVMFVSSVFLFDFGWFREQFCIIACPYGRIQSVMMDQNSLVVAYDTKRGEPRRAKDVPKDQQGDCVNCFACVRSCPTGIDIRRGTQLECIACTNCIDACDDIMTKLKKNTGLIRYDTENGLNGQPSKKLKTRSVIYLTIIAIIVATFIVVLQRSYDLKTQFVRGKQVFVEIKLDDGVAGVLNQYKLTFDYKAEDKPEIMMRVKTFIKNQVELVTPKNPYSVMIGHQSVNVFFKFRKDLLVNGNLKIVVEFVNTRQPNIVLNEQEVNLVGPVQ